MQLDDGWRRALSGTTFSAAGSFPLTTEGADPWTRFDAARLFVEGRTVLHVGCVDHLAVLSEKIAGGTWMHQVLCDAARRCGGVDINADGIAAMRELGFNDLWVEDAANPRELASTSWDVLFLGEMLEHVDDPVAYLSALRHAWIGRCEFVVITVPNALGWSTLRAAVLSGSEHINTDHRYWFTPFTAAKVATSAGFTVDELLMCESFGMTSGSRVSRAKQSVLARLLMRRPLLRSVVVAKLRF